MTLNWDDFKRLAFEFVNHSQIAGDRWEWRYHDDPSEVN